MKMSLTLIAGALALSAALTLRPAINADRALDEKFEQGFLQDELTLLAHADHNHALDKGAGRAQGRRKGAHPEGRGAAKKMSGRHADRAARVDMARSWREFQHKNELRHAEMGKYADLYLQPARPVHAQYTKQDQTFSANASYAVATKAHNDAGVSIDVAQAAFGNDAVRLRDAMLASELVAKGKARHLHDYVPVNDGTFVSNSAVDASVAATSSSARILAAATGAGLPAGADQVVNNAAQIRIDASGLGTNIETLLVPIVGALAAARARQAAIDAYIATRADYSAVPAGGVNQVAIRAAAAAASTAAAKNAAVLAASGAAGNALGVFAQDAYLGYLANDALQFKSERRRAQLGLNFNRYFFDHRFAVGVQVPVVEVRHILNLAIDDNIEKTTRAQGQIDSLAAAMYRYDGDQEMLQDFFAAKGMDSIGGKSAGIGDVELYAQARIDTHYLDRAVLGLRVVCPTAPEASTKVLWAPTRGNGGFFQTGLSLSAVSHYKSYFNPHFFIEGLYSLPATTSQRVPKKVTVTEGMDQAALSSVMPLGYRLDTIPVVAGAGTPVYQGFDSPFRGLGDTVSKLKTAKGLAFDVRIGNIFEEVFVRRANLDVFYNFKIKGRDRVYGLPESEYNLAVYEQNSDQIEHRLGGEWRWQVNHAAAVRLGIEQVLWGKNVAQDTQVSAGLNYGF